MNVRYAESNGLSANAPPLLSLTHKRQFAGEPRRARVALILRKVDFRCGPLPAPHTA
jgi:hypothetical protein